MDGRVLQRSCEQARTAFSVSLDGEASSEAELLATAHISHCLDCQEFAAQVAKITRVLRSRSCGRAGPRLRGRRLAL
jgi:predicted anti-sigma-YlaC factor YlaD